MFIYKWIIFDNHNTELFSKFVKIAIKCRNIQRRNKYGLTDESTYTKPVMITKLSDIQKNMLENDEIVFDWKNWNNIHIIVSIKVGIKK